MKSKTVAIIGAGPGGLVAAKTLLKHPSGAFEAKVFDKKPTVGGLWAVPRESGRFRGGLDPELETNVSKYFQAFSDLSWESIDLSRGAFESTEAATPTFLSAWMAGEYLREYARRYIPKTCLMLGINVVRTEQVQKNGQLVWEVVWRSADGNVDEQDCFDYLIVTTGFQSQRKPSKVLTGFINATACADDVNVIHSSEFNKILHVSDKRHVQGGTILVVGDGVSAAETVETLIRRMHSTHADQTSKGPKIMQVCSRPFYPCPPMLPQAASPDSGYPTFLPWDLTFFNLSAKPPGQIDIGIGRASAETSKAVHGFFESALGREPATESLRHTSHDHSPYAILSDSYLECIRSGEVDVVPGRLTSLQRREHIDGASPEQRKSILAMTATIHNSSSNTSTIIDDVSAVIDCSGYTAVPVLDALLPESVLKTLEFDSTCHRLPLILDHFQTSRGEVPNLAFVGFFAGGSWALYESQARLIAHGWAQNQSLSLFPGCASEETEARLEILRDLRVGILKGDKDVPQFPTGDWVAYFERVADVVGIKRNDEGFGQGRQGPAIPARYLDGHATAEQKAEAEKTLRDLRASLERKEQFVVRAGWRSLQGTWNVTKRTESAEEEGENEEETFAARFVPRVPGDQDCDAEYAYEEAAQSQVSKQFRSPGHRRSIILRYAQVARGIIPAGISMWTVPPDHDQCHLLCALKAEKGDGKQGLTASASYQTPSGSTHIVSCIAYFAGVHLTSLEVTEKVQVSKTRPGRSDCIVARVFSR